MDAGMDVSWMLAEDTGFVGQSVRVNRLSYSQEAVDSIPALS